MELFLIKGLILGFSIAAPVGPIGVLCIRRTLANGMLHGFVTGCGTASADAIYGSIAAFGITAISILLLDHLFLLHFCGGLFLLYLGYTTFRTVPAETAAQAKSKGLLSAYTSAFLLTLTNPATILSFVAVFAGLGVGAANGDWLLAGSMVGGVFAGSLLWWLLLSSAIYLLRAKLDRHRLKRVNQLSGLIIIAFGLLSLWALAVG